MVAAEHRSEWVQPIVVDKAGTHHETVKAAAVASVLAWHAGRDVDPEPWAQWLSGPFTKTVRRATRARLERVADEHGGVTIHLGGSCATALPPVRYVDLPRDVARLQVSGTDLPRVSPPTRRVIDTHVDMRQPMLPVRLAVLTSLTTGKAAAQAAHALFGWALQADADALEAWAHRPLDAPVDLADPSVLAAEAGRPGVIAIHDAGFTEVAPHTLTAVAVPTRRQP